MPLRILSLGKPAEEVVRVDIYLLTDRRPTLLPVRAPGWTDATEDAVMEAALASEKVEKALGGREPRDRVFVPGRVLNLLT